MAIMNVVPLKSTAAGPFQPVTALRGLAAFAIVGVGISGVAVVTGWGLPCPWRALTGTLCPLCGATHVGMALLRGDLAAAWAANPFVLAGLVVLVGLGVIWTIEALGGPAVRAPRGVRLGGRGVWVTIGLLAFAFTLWRNLAGAAG